MISLTKNFLRQPICHGIYFRSPCNVRQTILYEQYWSQNITMHVITLHTKSYASIESYDSTYKNILCASLSPAQENIVQDKTIIGFTDAPMLASHIIFRLKIKFKHTFESKHFSFSLFRVTVGVWLGLRLW